MNNQMLGADPAQLRELAAVMKESSAKFNRTAETLHPAILNSRWYGPDAERMRSDWQRNMRPRLFSARDLLISNAKILVEQAAEQEKASAADSGGASSKAMDWIRDRVSDAGKWVGDRAEDYVERIRERQALQEHRDELQKQLDRMDQASEADVKAWWASLSEEDKKYLIEASGSNNVPRAVDLAALKDKLPIEAQREIHDYLVKKSKESIPLYTNETKFRVEGQVGWVHGEAHISSEIVENADGSATLTVAGGAGGGVNSPGTKAGADITLSGEYSRTYEFASRADADAALAQMVDDLPPDGIGSVKDAVSDPPGYIVDTLDNAAKENGSLGNTQSVMGSISVGAHGGLSDNVEGSARLTMEYEQNLTTGASTASLGVSAEAKLDLGDGLSLSGDGEAKVLIDMNPDSSVQRLTLTVQGTVDASMELRQDAPGTPVGQKDGMAIVGGSGVQGTVRMEIYNTDENAQLISNYLRHQASGDSVAVAKDIQQICQASGVTLQANAVANSETNLVDYDAWAASLKVGVEGSVTSNISTGYKPPYADGFSVITGA